MDSTISEIALAAYADLLAALTGQNINKSDIEAKNDDIWKVVA